MDAKKGGARDPQHVPILGRRQWRRIVDSGSVGALMQDCCSAVVSLVTIWRPTPLRALDACKYRCPETRVALLKKCIRVGFGGGLFRGMGLEVELGLGDAVGSRLFGW